MSNRVSSSTYYSAAHCTGPSSLYVGLRFGEKTEHPPIITKIIFEGHSSEQKFDLEEHVREVLVGVDRANQELSGNLHVVEIQVSPDDYPMGYKFSELTAYWIACAVLKGEVK